MCFINDILMTGNTEQDHLKTPREVLQRLDKHNVRVNKNKCQFLNSEVTYLGYTVSANGIQPIKNKVKAIRKAPPAANHRPLTNIFVPKTGISSMATALVQRWALILSEYQYNIKYIPSKENANADMLMRMLIDKPDSASPDEISSVCTLTVNELPVTSQHISEATHKDTTLA